MIIRDVTREIEKFAPLNYQEDYDNSGLLSGSHEWEITGVLLSLDCTEAVVDEAIKHGCNLIVSHHPLIFTGLKKLSTNGFVERTLIKAIKNNIALYACHTNIDNVKEGVNRKIAEKLGLENPVILAQKKGLLKKLVTFVPAPQHDKVLQALFDAGAGEIGNYDRCSFNLEGQGTFRGNELTNPFIGSPGKLSKEQEIRIETIFKNQDQQAILKALKNSHPYEEIAYDIYSLDNSFADVGSGMVAELNKEMSETDFLEHVKSVFKVPMLKHTALRSINVKKVAVCGGSGRFLLNTAIRAGADAYITADFKYHEFFDADGKILLIDTGHYESEQFTPEIFYDIIRKKFSTFAIRLSETITNPVNYF